MGVSYSALEAGGLDGCVPDLGSASETLKPLLPRSLTIRSGTK
jgi:hypothetical protein